MILVDFRTSLINAKSSFVPDILIDLLLNLNTYCSQCLSLVFSNLKFFPIYSQVSHYFTQLSYWTVIIPYVLLAWNPLTTEIGLQIEDRAFLLYDNPLALELGTSILEESETLALSVDNLKMSDCTASHSRRPYSRSQLSEPEISDHILLFLMLIFSGILSILNMTIENTAKTNWMQLREV